MSSPDNLENGAVGRKRKRQLADEFEWGASVIEHQEVKQEAQDEQDDIERLRQRQERKKAVKVRKQKMLEKAYELRNDALEDEEPYPSDSDVEIIGNPVLAKTQAGTVVSLIDSGRANREARKDNPTPSVEPSQAAKTPAPPPPATAPPFPPPPPAPALSTAIIAVTTPQAQPSSSQALFAPILPPMSGLKKYEAAKRQSGAKRSSDQDGTSSDKRTKFLSIESSHFSHSSQSCQSSQSNGAATEFAHTEAGQNVATTVPPLKPAQIMYAPSRNTKRLTLTPKNTPAAPEQALPIVPETVSETAPRPACKTVLKSATAPTKRGPGRPKGTKNKPRPTQQSLVANGAAPFSEEPEEAQKTQDYETNEQSRSSSYLEVEAAVPRSTSPPPIQSLAGNRKSRRAAVEEAKRIADKAAAAAKKAQSSAKEIRMSNVESTVLAGNSRARTQATTSGWTAANHVPIVSDYSASVPQVTVLVRRNSELRINLEEEDANRAQEKEKKGDEFRASQEEEGVKEQAARRSKWEAEEEAKQDAARRAKPEAKGKGVRRLDEEADRRRRKHGKGGRNASVMRHGTPFRHSGTTREIERMKKMSIVVATDRKRAIKPQTTKEMPTPDGSAAQAQQETKKKKADARASGKLVAENRECSVNLHKMDVLLDSERAPDDMLHEELLDAIDTMGKAEADDEADMDDRDLGPTPPATQTLSEQSSEASSIELRQHLLLASVRDRRLVPMRELPTPPASQELLKPSIESNEQEEDSVTPLRQTGSSINTRLATPAGTITALPATPSFRQSGGPSAVMFGVISRLTMNLPEEMQEKVVEYVLCMEKIIPELPISPMIYTGHPTTPFFQVTGHPSAMWHEVITTLAIDLLEEEQKAVVEYILVLKKNKKQSVRSKTIG